MKCHTSHATRHTPHVARHTSHATRHTPHATYQRSHGDAPLAQLSHDPPPDTACGASHQDHSKRVGGEVVGNRVTTNAIEHTLDFGPTDEEEPRRHGTLHRPRLTVTFLGAAAVDVVALVVEGVYTLYSSRFARGRRRGRGN